MITRTRSETNGFPERMKPAPHVRPDGTTRPPIGTLRQELCRATRKTPAPVRLSERFFESVLATLDDCPQLARQLARRLGVRH